MQVQLPYGIKLKALAMGILVNMIGILIFHIVLGVVVGIIVKTPQQIQDIYLGVWVMRITLVYIWILAGISGIVAAYYAPKEEQSNAGICWVLIAGIWIVGIEIFGMKNYPERFYICSFVWTILWALAWCLMREKKLFCWKN